MLHPVWAALLLTFLASCPGSAGHAPAISAASSSPLAAPSQSPTPASPQPSASCMCGGLSYDGKQLTWEAPSGATHSVPLSARPVPYQIASTQPPILVTALLPDLEPLTYAVGSTLTAYPGYLPQLAAPPLVALTALPDPLTGVHDAMLLLGPTGDVRWSPPTGYNCELASPAVTSTGAPSVAYVLCWQGGDAYTPYGEAPELHAIPLNTTGTERVLALPVKTETADVVVLGAAGSHVLLLAQYGYQDYEFLLCDISAKPRLVQRWTLEGQPITRQVFPGPASTYTGLQLEGEALRLVVHSMKSASAFELWSIDLAAGRLSRTPYTEHLPRDMDAANQADANAGQVPYPQTLLPTAGEPPWTIPAVCNQTGQVLVIDQAGNAAWVTPDATAIAAAPPGQQVCLDKACVTPPGQ